MSRPTFPLSINRRRLLTSAAGMAAAGIVPLRGSIEAAAVQAVIETGPLPSLTPEASPGSVSAATARRFLEIARRNEIRRGAELPLLSKAKELRRSSSGGGERRATQAGIRIGRMPWLIKIRFEKYFGNNFAKHAERAA